VATSDLPRDLVKHLRDLKARLERQERRDPFANTGLSVPSAGEVDMTGLLRVLGELIVSGLAVIDAAGGIQSSNYIADIQGWRFNGTAVEINTGIIGNNALANPVIPGAPRAATSGGFALSTSFATLASATVTVPAGMTQVAVSVSVRLYAINPNTTGGGGAGTDAIYVRALIGASNYSTATPALIPGSNGYVTTVADDSWLITGLTGGASLTLAVQGRSAYAALAFNAGNYASISATLSWYR
jgi:hypothetical protein